MKTIVKGEEPQAILDWKKLENPDWTPSYALLSGRLKQLLLDALMKEQGFICCYCESKLVQGDCHVEHFQPQSDPAVKDLDYQNLHASCLNRLKKGDPRHCGNLKGNWFHREHLISPQSPDCQTRFSFLGNGAIIPATQDDIVAQETIKQLGLDIAKLSRNRKAVIDTFLDEDLADDEIELLVERYLEPTKDGRFNQYWTTIQQIFSAG